MPNLQGSSQFGLYGAAVGLDMKDLADSSSEKWEELWLLMAQLQSIDPAELVRSGGGDKREDGVIEFPWTSYHPTVNRIEKLLYDLNVIQDVDWTRWKSEIDPELVFDVERIKSGSLYDTVCLLTGIIRTERFRFGVIARSLLDGTFVMLLKSLNAIIKNGTIDN